MVKTLDTATFISRAQEAHGTRYDYSLSEYAGALASVTIVCRQHGPFSQRASSHWSGRGCPECGRITSGRQRRVGLRRFLERARAVHGDRYDYSQVIYRTWAAKVTIICPRHGSFRQAPLRHVTGRACRQCGMESKPQHRSLLQSEFLERARAVHGGAYDYSEVDYHGAHQKVTIICPHHGPFRISPWSHLGGTRCSRESGSNAERLIHATLVDLGFTPEREWAPRDLKSDAGYPLRFDFAILETKTLIEFDGDHHRHPVAYGGMSPEQAIAAHRRTVRHDRAKNAWAGVNGWTLIRLADAKRVVVDLGAALAHGPKRAAR